MTEKYMIGMEVGTQNNEFLKTCLSKITNELRVGSQNKIKNMLLQTRKVI